MRRPKGRRRLSGPEFLKRFDGEVRNFCEKTDDPAACVDGGTSALIFADDRDPKSFESTWGRATSLCFREFGQNPKKLDACDEGAAFAAGLIKGLAIIKGIGRRR